MGAAATGLAIDGSQPGGWAGLEAVISGRQQEPAEAVEAEVETTVKTTPRVPPVEITVNAAACTMPTHTHTERAAAPPDRRTTAP
jgi:hypothetical protein